MHCPALQPWQVVCRGKTTLPRKLRTKAGRFCGWRRDFRPLDALRHVRATVASTPAASCGEAVAVGGRSRDGSRKMSQKEAKTQPWGAECDRRPRSPRGQGDGDGRLGARAPPQPPPVRAPLSPRRPAMAAPVDPAQADAAQVSARRFGRCRFAAGSERAPGLAGAAAATLVGGPFCLGGGLKGELACHVLSLGSGREKAGTPRGTGRRTGSCDPSPPPSPPPAGSRPPGKPASQPLSHAGSRRRRPH